MPTTRCIEPVTVRAAPQKVTVGEEVVLIREILPQTAGGEMIIRGLIWPVEFAWDK